MDRGDLVGFIDRARKSGRHLPYPFVRYYGLSLAAALRAVHAAQMVHRDVKPDNVLIASDGVAKLTDFGIAKDISPDAIRLTEMGQTMGTLGFMAPEQLAGLPGPQSDIFSFGITLYVMLVGRLPPQKELNAIPVGRILPEAWAGLSPAVVSFLQKTTAADLEERFQSFDECIDQLGKVNFGADNRGLLLPGELPPLPSGAFITVSATSIEGPAPLIGFDAELARRDGSGRPEDLGDTMDLTTMSPEVQEAAGAPEPPPGEGVGVKTGFETRIGADLTGVPQRPTEGVRDVDTDTYRQQFEGVGQTRAFTSTDAGTLPGSSGDSTEGLSGSTEQALAAVRGGGSSKGLLVGVIVVLLVAVGVIGVMMSKPAAPSDESTLMALRAFEAAARDGNWSIAESTVSGLPAAAADLDAGKVLTSLDLLLAGDAFKARDMSKPLCQLDGELGARAGLVYAAATRLASVDGYSEAAESYARVGKCSDPACASLRERAERARAEVCLVLGNTAADCGGLTTRDERTTGLLASLVLLEDGHGDRGQLVLASALTAGNADGGCVENSVLSRWAAEPSLSAVLRERVSADGGEASRSAEQCALFGK